MSLLDASDVTIFELPQFIRELIMTSSLVLVIVEAQKVLLVTSIANDLDITILTLDDWCPAPTTLVSDARALESVFADVIKQTNRRELLVFTEETFSEYLRTVSVSVLILISQSYSMSSLTFSCRPSFRRARNTQRGGSEGSVARVRCGAPRTNPDARARGESCDRHAPAGL